MRDKYNEQELEAARILDAVKIGMDVHEYAIRWALWVLGDAVGIRD